MSYCAPLRKEPSGLTLKCGYCRAGARGGLSGQGGSLRAQEEADAGHCWPGAPGKGRGGWRAVSGGASLRHWAVVCKLQQG